MSNDLWISIQLMEKKWKLYITFLVKCLAIAADRKSVRNALWRNQTTAAIQVFHQFVYINHPHGMIAFSFFISHKYIAIISFE